MIVDGKPVKLLIDEGTDPKHIEVGKALLRDLCRMAAPVLKKAVVIDDVRIVAEKRIGILVLNINGGDLVQTFGYVWTRASENSPQVIGRLPFTGRLRKGSLRYNQNGMNGMYAGRGRFSLAAVESTNQQFFDDNSDPYEHWATVGAIGDFDLSVQTNKFNPDDAAQTLIEKSIRIYNIWYPSGANSIEYFSDYLVFVGGEHRLYSAHPKQLAALGQFDVPKNEPTLFVRGAGMASDTTLVPAGHPSVAYHFGDCLPLVFSPTSLCWIFWSYSICEEGSGAFTDAKACVSVTKDGGVTVSNRHDTVIRGTIGTSDSGVFSPSPRTNITDTNKAVDSWHKTAMEFVISETDAVVIYKHSEVLVEGGPLVTIYKRLVTRNGGSSFSVEPIDASAWVTPGAEFVQEKSRLHLGAGVLLVRGFLNMAATSLGAMMYSEDEGATWELRNTPKGRSKLNGRPFLISPWSFDDQGALRPGVVGCTAQDDDGYYIFTSSDGMMTWQKGAFIHELVTEDPNFTVNGSPSPIVMTADSYFLANEDPGGFYEDQFSDLTYLKSGSDGYRKGDVSCPWRFDDSISPPGT